MVVGFGLIAISVLGESPGYGVLSLYIIYCMTLSHVMFFLRVAIMVTLVGCHVGAIMIWNKVRREAMSHNEMPRMWDVAGS